MGILSRRMAFVDGRETSQNLLLSMEGTILTTAESGSRATDALTV